MDKALQTYMSFLGTATSTEIPNQHDDISVVELFENYDWASTPLGPMDSWEPTLKSTVKLCINSVFPIAIYYDREHLTTIYNQMWVPILKSKHPYAMGKSCRDVWTEVFGIVKPLYDEVFDTGKGRFEADMLFMLYRDGYFEEAYFSFTVSPIFKEDGTVGGIFNAGQETTQRVLANRRLKTLSELGNRTPGAKSVENSCHLVTQTLQDQKNKSDVSYSLIYLVENSSSLEPRRANLISSTFDEDLDIQKCNDGVDEITFVPNKSKRNFPVDLLNTKETVDLTIIPDEINELINDSSKLVKLRGTEEKKLIFDKNYLSTWPLEYVSSTNSYIIVTLKDDSTAVLYPVKTSSGSKSALTAIIIFGINPHRALDHEYLDFLQLVVGQVSVSLTNGKSREEERKQAEILADLNRQKIMFFQNISHELRTPITLMLSPLDEIISEYPHEAPMYSNLCMVQRNTRRLLKLVNTLLQFSRIEAGRMEAIYNEVNIGQLTSELAANFESMAKSLKLEYRIEIPDNFDNMLEKKAFVDPEMYEKIVFNLCSNAFKHTWNGNVTVKLYADMSDDKEIVVLEVSDTGVGIPENEIPRLFQRFYRVESRQSRSHEGTGIGLALIHELIKRHGGDITCTSEVDKGTTFRIWLPTGHEHLPSDKISQKKISEYYNQDNKLFDNKQLYLEEGAQWIQNHEPGFNEDTESPGNDMNTENMDVDGEEIGENEGYNDKEIFIKNRDVGFPSFKDDPIPLSGSKYVVLLADDNADMRNYLAGLLRKEFIVHCACDGREALRKLKKLKNTPDLILSDIMMPNMNGIELLKNLRDNIDTQLIPVILLSAKAGEEASIEGLEGGADDYLTKPFSARELIARVRVNIRLSYLRRQLFLQQRCQAETKQLLFSISNKINSGSDLKETLSTVAEEIHEILPADRILITANENLEDGDGDDIIVAFSSKDKNEINIEGQPFKFTSERIRLQSDPIIVEKLIKEIEKRKLSNISFNENNNNNDNNDNYTLFVNQTLEKLSSEDGISQDPFNLPPLSPSSLLEESSSTSSISTMSTIQNNFDDNSKNLEIAIIPNFYSINAQKCVSLLAVAIKITNSIWGWIIVHRPPNHDWLDSEKEFLQQISNQISLAITHAKLLKDKLRREAQIEAARAANEAKSQILANTSHELRTPLGAIIGVLSAFEDTALTDDQKDMIQIMTRASDVVLAVVNDILDAAKLEAQKIKLINRTFDLFDIVEKTIEIFGEKAGTKKIELILDCEPSSLPKYVKSDPERLQQILMNLLSNSIKFTEEGQIVLKISVSSCEEETGELPEEQAERKVKLFVELCDTGIGIDPAFMNDIFKSFSQGDASMTRRQDGTGLGLSICKQLIDINGGKVGVNSKVEKGSQFWFTWFVEPLSMTATPTQDPSSTSSLILPSIVQHKRVLIIDPIETGRDSLTKLIDNNVNKVDSFGNCEEGIITAKQMKEKYNESPYDVVFFNVHFKNAELIKNSALQLRSICGQDLSIVLLVFSSAEGRALGKDLIHKIGGHTTAICKPVMQRRLLDCLYNIKHDDIVSEKDYNYTKSLADIRVENYYNLNRPKTAIKDIKNSNNHQENTDAMIIDQDYVVKVEETKPQTHKGVKRNANDNDTRALKSRSRETTKSKCILCVEDNPINLQVIQHQLAKLGYPTLSATNGQEAINVMEAELANIPSSSKSDDLSEASSRISLILMDCAMPIVSGFDASKAIRLMQPPISDVPIIALTASAVQGTRDKCLESGMNDYLTKPLKIGQLREMLIQWLGDE